MNRIFSLAISVSIAIAFILSIIIHNHQPGLSTPNTTIESPVTVALNQKTDFGQHFKSLGVEGSILIYDLKRDRTYQHNPQRNTQLFPTASTFKILNSLIALETGVISNELSILTWDGISRQLPQWNQDLNLKEAFKLSAVWFYQVLARRVGSERMQKYITQVGYGNQKIGNKEDIDRFWLTGELRTTPQEQVKFLQRLYKNDLPFQQRTLSIVKDIMIAEQTPEYTLRGKTGWFGFGEKIKPQIGWYVGYLEKDKNAYFFATNININDRKDASIRIELTRRCFKNLGLL